MARRFHVEGTRAFLYGSVVCAIIAAWHIKDGFFPSQHWLDKYPDPSASFWLYNKFTGVIFAVATVVLAYIHRIVK